WRWLPCVFSTWAESSWGHRGPAATLTRPSRTTTRYRCPLSTCCQISNMTPLRASPGELRLGPALRVEVVDHLLSAPGSLVQHREVARQNGRQLGAVGLALGAAQALLGGHDVLHAAQQHRAALRGDHRPHRRVAGAAQPAQRPLLVRGRALDEG